MQAWIARIEQPVVFLARAVRVVAQFLNAEGHLAPAPAQIRHRGLVQPFACTAQFKALRIHGAPDEPRGALKAMPRQDRKRLIGASRRDLHDGARLLGKAGRNGVRLRTEVKLEPAAACKGHLEQRDQHAAVGSIVIGEHKTPVLQLAHGRKECRQQPRFIQVRRSSAQPAMDLRPAGSAEAVLAEAKVDQQQLRVVRTIELRCQRRTHIANRGEGRDDQRDWREYPVFALRIAPGRLHRQRILADRDRDAERRA